MDQSARVIAVDGKKATVRFTRSQACAHCGACIHFGSDQAEVVVNNLLNAKVGDRVVLELHAKSFLQASLWAYVLPLCLLLFGVYFGSRQSDLLGVLLGLGGAAAGYLILRLREPKFSRMSKFNPRMISFDYTKEEPDIDRKGENV